MSMIWRHLWPGDKNNRGWGREAHGARSICSCLGLLLQWLTTTWLFPASYDVGGVAFYLYCKRNTLSSFVLLIYQNGSLNLTDQRLFCKMVNFIISNTIHFISVSRCLKMPTQRRWLTKCTTAKFQDIILPQSKTNKHEDSWFHCLWMGFWWAFSKTTMDTTRFYSESFGCRRWYKSEELLFVGELSVSRYTARIKGEVGLLCDSSTRIHLLPGLQEAKWFLR